MPNTPSLMSLHLSYRLWIAEMNFDITVLRIFDDSLQELLIIRNEPPVKEEIEHFEQLFTDIRKEIDSIKHEMHLVKMKLAAVSKENNPVGEKTPEIENHAAVKKTYFEFRKKFDAIKKDYKQFENKWMQ